MVPPPDHSTERQLAVTATDPEMIRQTAELIASELGVAVAADARMACNGRPSAPLTDPTVVVTGAVPIEQWPSPAPA